MIKKQVFLSFLLAFIHTLSLAQVDATLKINWKTYDEGVKEATKKKKLMVIDVYTSWCGWCKVMDKSTFTDPDVVKYGTKKYVFIKLNAEGNETIHYKNIPLTEREFAKKILAVSSFPTTVYLDAKEEILSAVPGYLEAKKFKQVLVFFAEDYYKKTSWAEFEKTYHE
jgi:thioredoxin-related protein